MVARGFRLVRAGGSVGGAQRRRRIHPPGSGRGSSGPCRGAVRTLRPWSGRRIRRGARAFRATPQCGRRPLDWLFSARGLAAGTPAVIPERSSPGAGRGLGTRVHAGPTPPRDHRGHRTSASPAVGCGDQEAAPGSVAFTGTAEPAFPVCARHRPFPTARWEFAVRTCLRHAGPGEGPRAAGSAGRVSSLLFCRWISSSGSGCGWIDPDGALVRLGVQTEHGPLRTASGTGIRPWPRGVGCLGGVWCRPDDRFWA